MKRVIITMLLFSFLVSCGGWGDYEFKSERFKFKMSFPDKWEVWDRSDDRRDFLVANLVNLPGSEISLVATPVAPDISPHEIYPSFLEGDGDYAIFKDFLIENQGTISAKNAEGRFINVQYENADDELLKSLRAIFLGNRFILEIRATVPEDQFLVYEPEFKRMIGSLEFKR